MVRRSHEQFERRHRKFRGSNDERVDYQDLRQQIVDTVDAGLLGQAGVGSSSGSSNGEEYSDNEMLWNDLLMGTVRQGDSVLLKDFQILEWLPSCPGRYFTPKAEAARKEAEGYWSWRDGEYLPLGKLEMVLGGVGCVRLAPRFIRGGEVCFLGATSNGIGYRVFLSSLHWMKQIRFLRD
jgi:hypothetical protein